MNWVASKKTCTMIFSGISPVLCAKVNLRGTYIIDQRLNSIQLTLCSKKDNGELRISYKCATTELKKLFESYEERYGKPTLLEQGEKYEWLSKRISNVYLPGPKGRLAMDKMYFWEKGNYIIYFDFGYPENMVSSVSSVKEPVLPDSTGAPIIYFDFTQDYIDKLLEMAGGEKRR